MIEHMAAAPAIDGYAWACRRAAASTRKGSTDWPEFAPPVALSGGPLGVVQAADRELARQTAIRARGIAEFAASRPATADRSQGEPGAMSPERWAARPEVLRDVSEWAAQELAVALSISAEAAETLLVRSLTLVHRLPGTLAALEAGALHPGHLWPMLEKVARIENDTVRGEVEAELLRWSAGRVTTPAQLGAKARREVLRRDARAAARQLEKAIKERGVHVRPADVDGMATVTALLTAPEAHALVRALGEYADALPDDPDAPPRTRGQKMADCMLDLVLRPGECDLPPVQILLHVVASVGTLAGGDEPGEIDGHVVPAEMIRELVRALGPRPTTELQGQPATARRPQVPSRSTTPSLPSGSSRAGSTSSSWSSSGGGPRRNSGSSPASSVPGPNGPSPACLSGSRRTALRRNGTSSTTRSGTTGSSPAGRPTRRPRAHTSGTRQQLLERPTNRLRQHPGGGRPRIAPWTRPAWRSCARTRRSRTPVD